MAAVAATSTGSPAGSHDLAVFPPALKGKRILLCTESFGPVNGVSRTTLMLVNHLRANGANVAVVAPHNSTNKNTFIPSNSHAIAASPLPSPPPTPNTTQEQGHDRNVEVRLQGYPLPVNPELSIVYPVRLSQLYARTFGSAPDLIYLASPASLGFQVMLQLRQQKTEDQVPIICNFQTDLAEYCKILFPWPLGDCADYTFAMVQSFLFKHTSVKTIFYPSSYVRKYLERHGVQNQKTELLQRGVNTASFNPSRRDHALRAQTSPEGGDIILICVARVAAEKGFAFLARVATELDVRGLRFKLYIVGGNKNAAVEAETKSLFAHLVTKGKVIFAGFKFPGKGLEEAYASADLFLHCSITETFGLVVLESMASGVPVVARDMGGPSDTVEDGVSGYLVPPDDLHGFCDKVVLLSKDEKLRAHFTDNCRKQATEATWEKINNKAAWRILDTIEERERDVAEMQLRSKMSDVPVFGWLILVDAVRESLFLKSKLTAALGVIMAFWGLVSVYLVFIKAKTWLGRFRGWAWRAAT